MQHVIKEKCLLPASVERVTNIFCPGAVIQWLDVIFGIANEEIDILSSTARVVSDNSMSVDSVFYYKLERQKYEEGEDCLPLLHTTSGAPCTERYGSIQAPGENMLNARAARQERKDARKKQGSVQSPANVW